MKKLIILILAVLLMTTIIVLIVTLVISCPQHQTLTLTPSQFQRMRTLFLEEGYVRGQKDALKGDIRIQWRDTSYVWTKSPWATGEPPLFKPTSTITKY